MMAKRSASRGEQPSLGRPNSFAMSATDPDFYQGHEGETGCELAVPMVMGDRVIGVINVEHPEIGAFDEDDQKALEALAAQAAMAIHNAQNYAVLQRRAGALEALNKAGQAITGTLTFQQTLDEIVRQALALVGAKASGAFSHLALKSGNRLWFAAASDSGTLAGLQEAIGTLEVGDSRGRVASPAARPGPASLRTSRMSALTLATSATASMSARSWLCLS